MFKTGRLIIDTTTGKLVEETEQDRITMGVLPLGTEDLARVKYRQILRSKCTLKSINAIFQISAQYIKDPFGNIVWPKDWLMHLLPETATEAWKYVIVQKEPTLSTDEAQDRHYQGQTQVIMTGVPSSCTASELRQYILFGLLSEFDRVVQGQQAIDLIRKKQAMLDQRSEEIPRIQLEGTKEQQLEMRKNIATVMEKQVSELRDQLERAQNRLRKRKHVILSEPIQVRLVTDQPWSRESDLRPFVSEDQHQNQAPEELDEPLTQWYIACPSPRGPEILRSILDKTNWNEIRLFRCGASQQQQQQVLLTMDPHERPPSQEDREIPMQTIRAHRVRHGLGTYLFARQEVLASDFHISSIGSMYCGQWNHGHRHDARNALEYTNAGVYRGPFQHDQRNTTLPQPHNPMKTFETHSHFVYGNGQYWRGTFGASKGTAYCWSSAAPGGGRSQRKPPPTDYYPRSLLTREVVAALHRFVPPRQKTTSSKQKTPNREMEEVPDMPVRRTMYERFEQGLEHGSGCFLFADGAVYRGEMKDGRVTGVGKYISSAGMVQEGTFLKGQLHGLNGIMHDARTPKQPTYYHEGQFQHGQLHGKGWTRIQKGPWTYQYEGVYQNNVKQGYGKSHLSYQNPSSSSSVVMAEYRGEWQEDARHGFGIFDYRHPKFLATATCPEPNNAEAAETATSWPVMDYQYQGQFFDGLTTSRNCQDALHPMANRDHLPFTIRPSLATPSHHSSNKSRRSSKGIATSPSEPTRLAPILQYIHRQRKMERTLERTRIRRQEREIKYGRQKEYENLKLYFTLLDEKFESWSISAKRQAIESKLSPEEQTKRQQERQEQADAEFRTRMMKAGKYGLDMTQYTLDQFEHYIDRTPLTEVDKLA